MMYRNFAAMGAIGLTTLMLGSPATAAPLKIMPLGDSITYGTGSSTGAGYRGPLQELLVANAGWQPGVDFDFVGTLSDGSYGALPAFDDDHQGHPGYEADLRQTSNPSSPRPEKSLVWALGHDKNGDIVDDNDGVGVFDVVTPDVILLHIGTNSIGDGSQALSDINHEYNQLVRLLEYLRDQPSLSNTRILMAQIVPKVGQVPDDGKGVIGREQRYQNSEAYNNLMDDLIANFAASGDPADQDLAARMSLVDMFNAGSWVKDTDGDGVPDQYDDVSGLMTSDGTHPSDLGYDLMAQKWYDALLAQSLIPEPGTALLAFAGGAALLVRRRRRG